MSQLTDTLAANDRVVDGFMSDLTSVSSQLAADRGNLAKALAALARAVGTVRTFVHDNKGMVEKDVRELTRLLGVLARHKDDLNTLARIGALGLDNLTVAFDNKTKSIGSRLQAGAQRRQPRQPAVRHRPPTPKQVPGRHGADHLRAAQDDRRAVLGPDRGRPVAEPEPAGPAEARRLGPRHVARRPAERAEGGERIMSRSSRRLASGAVAALVLLLVTALVASGCKFDGAYDLPLPGNKVDADDAFKVTADFADALNVVPRTAVFANDVPVGQVTDVERVGWHARVTFLVRKDIELPENVEIDVRQTSLLGEKYIALVEPAAGTASAKRLSDGDFIPLSRTSRNPEVEEVLGALSMLLSGGGIGQLKTISHELNNMMNGRQDQARHLLGNLDRMIGGLDEQKGDIIARDGVHRPAVGDAGQGEGRHRRGHRQHGAGAEGAQPAAQGTDDDAAPARQARRRGHAGAQRQHRQHRRVPAPPAADADQARRRG